MSTPKSVVKINKNGVQYTSNVDATQYYIYELTRAALRDVGKFICKTFKATYYQHFKKRSGDAGRVTKYKVISGAKTTAPRVQVGLKTGAVPGFYAYFQEFGTSDGSVPKLSILTKTVNENVDTIVKIESQYLSGLSDEAARLEQLVNEKSYGGDADGDE